MSVVLLCIFFCAPNGSKWRAERPPLSEGGTARPKLSNSVPETARSVPVMTACRLTGTERALMRGHIAGALRTAATAVLSLLKFCRGSRANPEQNAVLFCEGVVNRLWRRREATVKRTTPTPACNAVAL